MIKPPYLKTNDTVAIVATARKITETELQPAVALLKSWGLQVVLGNSIGKEHHQFAGSDEERAQDLQQTIDDPTIDAIWCARGGYGTVRILDLVDFSNFKKNPKWIVGYSDITALHSHINTLGIESLHGPISLDIENKTETVRQILKDALFGNLKEITYINNSEKLGRNGTAKGELVGGNLSVLYSLLGSDSAITTEGKILFIEDLDEYLYHIDRMLQNFKRNGLFKNLAGLIVGGMSDMNDNTIPFGYSAVTSIWELVKEYDFPVCFNFPAGHIEDNRALIFGREVTLKVESENVEVLF